MTKLIQALVLCALVLAGNEAHAVNAIQMTGTLQYTRNWTAVLDPAVFTPPSLLAGNNTGVKPVKDMLIGLYSASKGGPSIPSERAAFKQTSGRPAAACTKGSPS